MDEKDADELADQGERALRRVPPLGNYVIVTLRNYVIVHTEGAHARGSVSLVPGYGLVRGRAGSRMRSHGVPSDSVDERLRPRATLRPCLYAGAAARGSAPSDGW